MLNKSNIKPKQKPLKNQIMYNNQIKTIVDRKQTM